MHTLSKIALLLGFVISTSFAGEGLPQNAATVLGKLEQFEEQTMLEAQVKIEAKRMEVVRYLEKQLDEVTRGGDLDGGIAIRSEIDRLKKLPTAQPVVKSVEKKEEKLEDQHVIVGRWSFEDKDGSELVREFTADGKCIQYRGGRQEWSLDYEVVNRREVDVVFLGALKFRHEVRGNDTLKTREPNAIAEREEIDSDD